MLRKNISLSLISLAAIAATEAHASCGSAFCMLNTNWSTQGVWTEPGARLDFRYEYVNQDELLHEDKMSDVVAHHQEQGTTNKNLQVTFDYAFNDTYGISINTPFVSRKHSHLHVSHADPEDIETESWDFSELGDMRIIGRMQLSPATNLRKAYGLHLGLKLPTGDYTLTNSEGELAERSLQPGTGTTDLILGGYYRQQLSQINAQWFAQALFISPLNERDDFQTGEQFVLDLGYRQLLTQTCSAMLQLNYSHKNRDSGTQAEPEDSGGNAYFLSPGLSYAVSSNTQLYGFVHHRLSQTVNGEQLSAKDSFVAGISTRF